MEDNDYKILLLINSPFIPFFITKKLMLKIGIDKYLDYQFSSMSSLFGSGSTFLNIAFKVDPDKTIEYLQKLNINDDYDTVKKLLSLKCFPKYAEYFSKDTIKSFILCRKFYSSDIKILLSTLDSLINEIILEDVKKDEYNAYLSGTTNEIRDIAFKHMDISQIMIIISKNSLLTSDYNALFKLRENDIEKHIMDSLENDPNSIFKFLEYNLPDTTYKKICDTITINNEFLKKVFVDMSCVRLQNYILKCYYEDVLSFLDILILNNDYKDLLKYSTPEEISKYIVASLDESKLKDLLNERYLSSSIKKVLYEVRKKDIIKIIVDASNNDLKEAIGYLNNIDDKDFSGSIIKQLDITKEKVEAILDSCSSNYLDFFYDIKKEYVIEYLLNKRKSDPKYFDKSFEYGYTERIMKELITDLTDEELVIIFANYHFGRSNKDIVFNRYKDRFINIFKNIFDNDKEKARAMLLDCGGTKFKDYVLNNFPAKDLIKIDIFHSTEGEELFKSRYFEFSKAYRELFAEDKYLLFKLAFNYKADDTTLNRFILNLYTDEDIFDVIKENSNNNKIFTIFSKEDIIYPRISDVVLNLSKVLAVSNWDEFIILLKGIRSINTDLFITTIKSLDIDDDTLNRLYTERGLSDNQKNILMSNFGDDIIRIVKENIAISRNRALDYLQKGSDTKVIDIVLENITKKELKDILDNDDFVKRRSIGEKFAGKLYFKVYEDESNIPLVVDYLQIYKGNQFQFIKYFETIVNFLKEIHISNDDFFQYTLNSSYDFIPDIVYIFNNRMKDFIDFKNYFFEKNNSDDVLYIINLLKVIKNFARYDDLCTSLVRNDSLNENNINDVLFLFGREETLSIKPKDITDCKNIQILIENNIKEMYLKCESILDYKNLICLAIFNCSYDETSKKLQNFGNTSDLIMLKYYNKNNEKLLDKIDEVLPCTAMIEDVISCDDLDSIKEISSNIINNLSNILNDLNFANYDEKMREIYALDADNNLTKLSDAGKKFTKDEESSLKYGVEVYDFSDKEYALLAHVKSSNESYEDLIEGKDSPSRNFISFSSISYRNEKYYWGARNIIFGYDELPVSNYVFSSVNNMGTNRAIKKNSLEVENITRTQRGILEISDTEGNSELLALRKNLKPKYIIIPGKRELTEEEIEVAKKYNLAICFVQEKGNCINNPIPIPNENNYTDNEVFIKSLEKLKSDLMFEKSKRKRRVAVLTDIHGLLEPSVAVLEDIRLKGIDEVYSLGDNIGTGPNPSEVIDLLKAYNVTSIKGNHELYLENISKYARHLINTNALEEETLNQIWTRENLRDDQLSEILGYKDYIVLNIAGKKILLCHYLEDYNTSEKLFNPDDYDIILEGHKHFDNTSNNVYTLKAVGIGNAKKDDIGTASYVILEEEDGDVKITPVEVKYNHKNALASINKSSANTRVKMLKWVGESK